MQTVLTVLLHGSKRCAERISGSGQQLLACLQRRLHHRDLRAIDAAMISCRQVVVCCATHLDANRQVAKDRCLYAVRNGAKLKNGYVCHQNSVAFCAFLSLHQVLNA